MMKNALILFGTLVLLAALFFWQLFANLDNLVEGVIEDVGSDVLKTKVSVAGVSIDLKGGKAVIARLIIANPDGYSRANLFEMKNIAVDLDLKSIGKDVLVINEIRIREPKINFEGDADGGSNILTLLENIDSDSSGEGGRAEGEATKMIINNFELSGAQVKAISEMKPGEPTEIKLPTVKMTGIGKAQGGVTADVVAEEISYELVGAIISAAAKAGIEKAIEKKKKGFLDKLKGKN
jgi:hypothetical protein